jgi:hypothetical protein
MKLHGVKFSGNAPLQFLDLSPFFVDIGNLDSNGYTKK